LIGSSERGFTYLLSVAPAFGVPVKNAFKCVKIVFTPVSAKRPTITC
jgi:hypothetical protein